MAIRLLIVSDCDARREMISALCRSNEISVFAVSQSGAAVLQHVQDGRPDVALIEAEIAAEAALTTLRLVRHQAPQLPVLVHPASDDPSLRAQAFLLGACGYLPASCSRRRYVQAVRMAASGNLVWSPSDMQHMA